MTRITLLIQFSHFIFRIIPYGHFKPDLFDRISGTDPVQTWHNLKWWTKMTKTKVIFKVNIPFMTGMIDRIDVFKILFSILNTKIIHSVIKLCFQALIMVFIIFYGI